MNYLKAVISRETGNYDRWVYLESNEPMITKLQAHWKGYLARKNYKERILFMKEQLPAILKIQVTEDDIVAIDGDDPDDGSGVVVDGNYNGNDCWLWSWF